VSNQLVVTDLVVRAAQPVDVPAIRRLQLDCAAEDTTYGYVPASHEQILAALGPYYVVADLRSQAMGFARGTMQVSPGLPVAPEGKRYLQLDDLYVATDYRRTDAGCKLVDFLLMTAKLEGIELALASSAAKDIRGSLRFYEACGFESWCIQLFKSL
jgi:GNAT superfamily N-acetyltransferase